jgi:hypothetical protein
MAFYLNIQPETYGDAWFATGLIPFSDLRYRGASKVKLHQPKSPNTPLPDQSNTTDSTQQTASHVAYMRHFRTRNRSLVLGTDMTCAVLDIMRINTARKLTLLLPTHSAGTRAWMIGSTLLAGARTGNDRERTGQSREPSIQKPNTFLRRGSARIRFIILQQQFQDQPLVFEPGHNNDEDFVCCSHCYKTWMSTSKERVPRKHDQTNGPRTCYVYAEVEDPSIKPSQWSRIIEVFGHWRCQKCPESNKKHGKDKNIRKCPLYIFFSLMDCILVSSSARLAEKYRAQTQ